jgi:hypothetical protein
MAVRKVMAKVEHWLTSLRTDALSEIDSAPAAPLQEIQYLPIYLHRGNSSGVRWKHDTTECAVLTLNAR